MWSIGRAPPTNMHFENSSPPKTNITCGSTLPETPVVPFFTICKVKHCTREDRAKRTCRNVGSSCGASVPIEKAHAAAPVVTDLDATKQAKRQTHAKQQQQTSGPNRVCLSLCASPGLTSSRNREVKNYGNLESLHCQRQKTH